MKNEPIRTLQEVLDEALKTTGRDDLYQLDSSLVKNFKLESLSGTTTQLMIVIQALRTAAMAVTDAAMNAANLIPEDDLDLLDDIEDTDEKTYEA